MNQQRVEEQIQHGDHLEVVDVWETIQGEGPLSGTPAVFVRFAGCNLGCSWCDTDYTSNRRFYARQELIREVLKFPQSLVVLTGGEPFRQPVTPLIRSLLACDKRVQVETNGTLWPVSGCEQTLTDSVIVCSPKTQKICERLIPHIDAWKYVITGSEISPEDGLPVGVARPGNEARVFIQPGDVGNREANRQKAIEICMEYGYSLSLQIHKIVGLA